MDVLLGTLKARDIQLGEDDVKWAFESPATRDEITAWVDEYLHNNTLLSSDEQRLSQRLSRLKKLPSGDRTRRVTDDELRSAIEDLERSTAAIQKQRTVLEKQKAALQEFQSRNSADDSVTRPIATQGTGRLDAEISESARELSERLLSINDHVDTATSSLATYATRRLESDDKVLDAILSMDLRQHTPAKMPDVKAVEQWCRSLIAFRTAEVKARVDELYNSKLLEALSGAVAPQDDQEERVGLQSELESLREEISSMSEMVVDHELRKPILDGLEAAGAARTAARSEWLGYIESALNYMAARAGALSYHAQNVHAFQAALSEVDSVFRPLAPPPDTAASSQANASGSTLPRDVTTHFDGNMDGNEPARLLRMLNADIDEIKGSTKSDLESLLQAKRHRSQRQQLAAEASNIQTLGEHVDAQTRSANLALDALYSHTQFNTKSLSNRELDAELQRVEEAVGRAGASISAVEIAQAESLPPGPVNVIRRFGA